MNVKKIYIGGMHCKGCVTLLTDELAKVKGVKNVDVSLKKETAKLYYDKIEPDFSEIRKLVKKLGYEASLNEPAKNGHLKATPKQCVLAFGISAGLLALYTLFKRAGFLDFINLTNPNINFGVSFLIGIVASLSTCFVIVGSIVIVFNEKYQGNGSLSTVKSSVFPNALFQAGRVVTFFLLGGLLGAVGGELNLSGRFVSIYTIIIAFVMLILSFNILGIFPSLNLGIAMPKPIRNYFSKLKTSNSKIAPLLLGGITFFLPCGFTQSMQIFALTSGSFTKGALSLLFFALGTLPVLLLTGLVTGITRGRKLVVFQKVAGILILVFAISTFSAGIPLLKVNSPILSSSNMNGVPSQNGGTEIPANEQVVEMHVTYNGFEPQTMKIKNGIPVKWVIYGDQVTGCTNHIVVPSINISTPVSSGETVVRFTPQEKGTINFSCWMGMVRGKFIVE